MPAFARLRFLEGHEQSVIVQPGRLLLRIFLESGMQNPAPAGLKGFPGASQHAILEGDDRAVIDAGSLEACTFQIAVIQNAVLNKELRANEIRIACERGKTLIGRVAEARGTQRQDLPPLLAGVYQGVDPGIGRRAEIADSVRPRQG